MTVNSRYRFLAEVESPRGEQVGALPLRPDWYPALEWCHFDGLRQGRHMPVVEAGSAVVEPVWHEDGPPFVGGVRVGMADLDGEAFTCDLPTAYFNDAVEKESAALVAGGKLTVGADFKFRVCAYAAPPEAAPAAKSNDGTRAAAMEEDDLEGELVDVGFATQAMSLASMTEGSRREGTGHWDDADLPVFIPADVIAELRSMARADALVESGAILIGRLCRDSTGASATADMFLEVTAQITARHTIAAYASLTFTGETWSSVNAALALRRRDEMIVGWAHSHPYFCRNCSAAERLFCTLSRTHFSASDVNVHRTVFSHAYQVALLLSFLGESTPRSDLFAWRTGRIAPRGYYVSEQDSSD